MLFAISGFVKLREYRCFFVLRGPRGLFASRTSFSHGVCDTAYIMELSFLIVHDMGDIAYVMELVALNFHDIKVHQYIMELTFTVFHDIRTATHIMELFFFGFHDMDAITKYHGVFLLLPP